MQTSGSERVSPYRSGSDTRHSSKAWTSNLSREGDSLDKVRQASARSGASLFQGRQSLGVELDKDWLFLSHDHRAGRLSLGFLDPLTPGIDHFPLPAFLQVAVEQGERGGVAQCFGRRISSFSQSHYDVRSRCAAR